jgi:hypothetical protein
MKKRLFTILILSVWIILSAFTGIKEDVTVALKDGNAFKISAFFKEQVDITILDESDLLSKLEAEKLLYDFFHVNKPSDFTILHSGNSRSGQEYNIGTLTTNNGNFRISIYIKKSENSEFIQQLIIEAE